VPRPGVLIDSIIGLTLARMGRTLAAAAGKQARCAMVDDAHAIGIDAKGSLQGFALRPTADAGPANWQAGDPTVTLARRRGCLRYSGAVLLSTFEVPTLTRPCALRREHFSSSSHFLQPAPRRWNEAFTRSSF
jgi:hypothetical protein